MFGLFTEDAQKVLVNAKKEMKSMRHKNICTGHVLLGMLSINNNFQNYLNKYGLYYKKVKDEIINLEKSEEETLFFQYSPILKKILEELVLDSKENNEEITEEKILISIIKEGDGIAYRLMSFLNIDLSSMIIDLSKKKKKNMKKHLISELGNNLTNKANNNSLDPVIGRDKEVNRIIEILSRKNKNNPILIGNAGVGKTAIVEELARRIVNYNVPSNLLNKKIISIDLASVVSGTKYRGEFEEKLKKIINELQEEEDVILFIDEIHTIVGAGSGEGAIDASNILKPYLARGSIKIIGATTYDEYKKYIEKDKALERRFQKVIIEEPNKKELKKILLNIKNVYENYHGVIIKNEIVDEIINMSELYLYDRCEPDRSIDILDEVCSKVSLKKLKEENELVYLNKEIDNLIKEKEELIQNENYSDAYILKDKEVKLKNNIIRLENIINKKNNKKYVKKIDVLDVVSSKSNIPLLNFKNLDEINKISALLKKKIINQDKAIDTLTEVTKKIKLNLNKKTKTYSLLFTGSSGVGKTFLAKTYAKYLTNNVIKIDMNEFTTRESINKLIGSPSGYVGYNDNNNLFEQIRNKPFSVLILDEIEKADKSVINLFLNILDEGYCVDNKGNKIRFDNVLIIMTSNAILKSVKVGFNSKTKSTINLYFPVEFINRIDEIIEFNEFNEKDIRKIIINEQKKYRNMNLTNEEIDTLIKECNYKKYGIRNLVRLIRKEYDKKIICNVHQ